MPILLNHGPASDLKTKSFLPKISSLLQGINIEEFQVILPSQISINWYNDQLSKNQNGYFTKKNFTTFPQFLKKILKLNIERFHIISDQQSRLIIRKVLEENNWYPYQRKYSQFIQKLRKTVIAIKKTGILNQQQTHTFGKSTQFELIKKIIHEYNQTLNENFYFDEGDLYGKTLENLKRKKLVLPKNLKYIFIDKIFPLHLVEREIIQLLNQNFPDIQIYINYDYDFKRQNIFTQPYEFLGHISSHQDYFSQNQLAKIELDSHPDPSSEIEFGIEKLKSNLTQTSPLENIALILPSEEYYNKEIKRLLKDNKIPYQDFTKNFIENKNSSAYKIEKIIDASRNYEESKIYNELNIRKILEEFNEDWDNHIRNLKLNHITQSILEEWKNDEKRFLDISHKSSQGINLIPFSLASHRNWEQIYIFGFDHKNFPQINSHHPLFQDDIWNHQDLREILEGSLYEQALQEERFLQILSSSHRSYLSLSRYSWEGKPLEVSYFSDFLENIKPKIHSHSSYIKNSSSSHFLNKDKDEFSVTELETYQECPYKYYHRYILNYDISDEDEIEIKSKEIGLIVHEVLEKLLKKNYQIYQSSVQGLELENKLFQELEIILRKEIKSLQLEKSQIILDQFFHRTLDTLRNYLKSEIQSIRDKIKITLPHFFEWGFGKKTKHHFNFPWKDKIIHLKGKIDRIDINEDLKIFSVIDYKTGELTPNSKITSGESLQIPVYLMAVQENLLPNYQPSSGILLGLKELGIKRGFSIKNHHEEKLMPRSKVSQEEWKNLQQIIKERIYDIILKIKQGEFQPKPKENSICNYCQYRDVCDY